MSKFVLVCFFVIANFSNTSLAITRACTATTLPSSLSASTILSFVDLRISCGSRFIEARLLDCSLQALGHNATSTLVLANASITTITYDMVDPQCIPRLQTRTSENGYDVVFYINISDCSPVIARNSTHLEYQYAIRTYLNPFVSIGIDRGYDVEFRFSCIYVLNFDIAMPLGITFTNSTSLTVKKLPTSSLAVAMALYKDSTYASLAVEDLSVTVPSHVYVGLTFTNGKANFLVLQGRKCWATPTSHRNNAKRVLLLTGGCPTSENIILYENYYSTQVRFAFPSFTWVDSTANSQFIYLHCKVSVCDSVLNDTCAQKECNGTSETYIRRKRSAQAAKTHSVTIGPIKIDSFSTQCGKNNGGCEQICSLDAFGKPLCSCHEGYLLLQKQHSCKEMKTGRVVQHENTDEMKAMMSKVKVAVLTVSVILLAGYVLIRFSLLGKLHFIQNYAKSQRKYSKLFEPKDIKQI
ncbi:unnamed protein product [Clavelina lepadiformis]|uniref:ZP domain-containing protein n=1 Tax=Clavelina lepadiformis TaxID=159417 RepID=A0ABP0GE18_CLALP